MRFGLDTNVLIYAHLPVSAESGRVRTYLRRALADSRRRFSLTPPVLHEFGHVATDPRRFEPPVTMPEALEIAGGYLDRSNVECLAVDEGSMRLAFDLLDVHGLGRRRIADTLLAATLLSHGVKTIVTCNPADFTLFGDLAVVDPRAVA